MPKERPASHSDVTIGRGSSDALSGGGAAFAGRSLPTRGAPHSPAVIAFRVPWNINRVSCFNQHPRDIRPIHKAPGNDPVIRPRSSIDTFNSLTGESIHQPVAGLNPCGCVHLWCIDSPYADTGISEPQGVSIRDRRNAGHVPSMSRDGEKQQNDQQPKHGLIMARRNKIRHDDETRAKIQAAQIINRLHDCIEGRVELSAQQVSAAKTLLAKVLPDLSSVDMSAIVEHLTHEEALEQLERAGDRTTHEAQDQLH